MRRNIIIGIVFVLSIFGSQVLAQEIQYKSLPGTEVAGITDSLTARDFGSLVNAGYQLLIGIAAVLAVVMIFYAGFRYATTTSPGAKKDAQNRILGALGGLLLALSSYLILSTINEELVGVNVVFDDFVEGKLKFDLLTDQGREALNQEHTNAIVVNSGGSTTFSGINGSGTIGGVATGGTVTFPSGASFQTVNITSEGGINYTDGGGGRFARGVGLIDTRGRENENLSRDFKVKDFKTKDGARYARISPRAVQGLQNIRDRAGIAISLTSAYRHPAYNNRVSQTGTTGPHTGGHAIDIRKPSGLSYEQLAKLVIDEFGCKIGLGMGGGMVHFDFRGAHQSWEYSGFTDAQVDSFYTDYCRGKM